MQQEHSQQLEAARQAGHDALAIVVEEYKVGIICIINSASKLSHPILWLSNLNLTLTLHQILSFRLIFLILISIDRKFSFAFDSVYRINVTYTM